MELFWAEMRVHCSGKLKGTLYKIGVSSSNISYKNVTPSERNHRAILKHSGDLFNENVSLNVESLFVAIYFSIALVGIENDSDYSEHLS